MDNYYKPKVLIVDDEKGIRLRTKRLLELEGYEVDATQNAVEGIEYGTKQDYDLAIIDLKMAGVDGLQVLKQIKKVLPNTVCFIAIAYPGFDTATESAKLWAFNYIPKPFTPEELLNNLKQGYDRRPLSLEAENWRKQGEESLLKVAFEKTRLNTIINSITEGVLVVNKSGQAVLYNPSALIYLQLPKIDIEEYIIDKPHPAISDLINKFLENKIFEKKSYSAQIEIKPNGELFIEATSSPVPHPEGSLAGVVV